MNRRAVEIAGFLAQNGWAEAASEPMDADLSPRRYARLEKPDHSKAILMDADQDQRTPTFVDLAKVLRDMGLHAPKVFAADPHNGLVLLEDLGHRSFGHILDQGEEALPLYKRAVDVLVKIHQGFDQGSVSGMELPLFDSALFIKQVSIFLDTYVPLAKNRDASPEERESFQNAWQDALRFVGDAPQTLVLRDYMPDNLMDIEQSEGLDATGLLDFQDAGLGPAAYDLASLCENVRRDGGTDLLPHMVDYYCTQIHPTPDPAKLLTHCRVLSAQRHCRILGIVTRWSQMTGRDEKLSWLPRTKKTLEFFLKDPVLQPVQRWMSGLERA